MKENTPEYVEVIKITENGEEHYHIKPSNGKYRFYKTASVPIKLFETYVKNRSKMMFSRLLIKTYFEPLKDKPMHISKYHPDEDD